MNAIQHGILEMYKAVLKYAERYDSQLKPATGYSEIIREIRENVNLIEQTPASVAGQRMNFFTRKRNKRVLRKLFKETDTLIAGLDSIVNSLGDNNFGFYLNYRNARRIPSSGRTSHSIIGLIKDKTSNTPLKGVTVTLQLNSNKPVIKKSASLGGFRLKNLPPGMYTVTGEKAGYQKEITEVAISDNILAMVMMEMVREGV